jgi:hypothetical protein
MKRRVQSSKLFTRRSIPLVRPLLVNLADKPHGFVKLPRKVVAVSPCKRRAGVVVGQHVAVAHQRLRSRDLVVVGLLLGGRRANRRRKSEA